MQTDLDQRQVEALDVRVAWASTTVLPRAFVETARCTAFRALAGELLVGVGARGASDEALLVACPELIPAAVACYSGNGPPLRECVDAERIVVLDWWLATEVRHWANRWRDLDPTSAGSAPSTREALKAIGEEIRERSRPPAIAEVIDRVRGRAPACPTRR